MVIARTLLLLTALLTADTAGAERYTAQLTPRPGSDSTASGSATLVLDDAETQITFQIDYQGLGSDEIASHIHSVDGSLEHLLPYGASKSGVWEDPPRAAIFGLRDGTLYILVHTFDYPDGEIAGDIVAAPVASDEATVSELKSRY